MKRVSHADRASWWAADTLLDLANLTARWLEGEIGSQPGYQPGYGPDEETEALIEILAKLNRAGFLTQCSQPGEAASVESDGATWAQRAAVTGFIEESRAAALVDDASKAGFEVVLASPAAGVKRFTRPETTWISVTTRNDETQTAFGGFWSRREIRRRYGALCTRTATKAIATAAQLTIVDPAYTSRSDLWDFLDEWARRQGTRVAELDDKRAAERLTTQLLAVLAAGPEASAYLTRADNEPSCYPAVLYLNTAGVLASDMTRWRIHEQDLPLLSHVNRAPSAYLYAFPTDQTTAEAMKLLADRVKTLTEATPWNGGDPWNTGN